MENAADGKMLPRTKLAGQDLLGFEPAAGGAAAGTGGTNIGKAGNDAAITKADIAKSGKGAAGKMSLAKSGKAANGKKACFLAA